MQLPDIPMAPVQDEVSPALEREAAAARGLGSVIEQGLTQYGQEVVKTQTTDAHLKLAQGIEQVDDELRIKKAYSPDELKQRLGDAFNQLPPEIRNQPPQPVLDKDGKPVLDATGQPQTRPGDIPTFQIADVLYKAEARRLLEEAKQTITVGQGWQAHFERAATGDLIQRWTRLNEYQLQAAHQYQVDARTRQALQLAYSGDFGMANAVVEGSKAVLGEDGQMKLRQHILGLQQTKPIYDALKDWRLEPTSPLARRELNDAAVRLADQAQMSMVDPQHAASLARQVHAALKQSDDLGKSAALKDEARRTLNQITIQTKGDPNATRAAIQQIDRTDLADEVEKRFKEGLNADLEVRRASDAPRVARLESGIDQMGSLDRHGQDYTLLSDEGRARVDAKFQAAIRARRSEGSEERRQQHEIDMTREAEFDALPLSGVPGRDQTSADIASLYPDVSPLGQARILAKQKKSALEWQKDQGVSREAFVQQARALADALHYTGGEGQPTSPRGQFMRAMQAERDNWFGANPTKKAMPPNEERRIFSEALKYYDPGILSKDVPAWQLRLQGKTETTPSKKQVGLEAIGRLLAPAAAGGTEPAPAAKTAPAPAPPAVPPAPAGTPPTWIPYRNGKTGEIRYNTPGKAKGDWKEAR